LVCVGQRKRPLRAAFEEGIMMGWRDQVAVVTGGARGLGRATAWLLAQRGAAVCVNYAAHDSGPMRIAAPSS
jgi:hypothetical protein